jgi:hypothetical protein
MAPFDPLLHDHEKRLGLMEGVRRDLEEQMVRMDAVERKHAATREVWNTLPGQRVVYQADPKRRHDEWWAYHRRAMKEFDDRLDGLIAWLDDFVRRNPKNGK